MDKVIAEVEKNAREYLRISLTQYKGCDLVDIRSYVEGNEGQKVPTKKGICFKTDLLGNIIDGLQEAQKQLVESSKADVKATAPEGTESGNDKAKTVNSLD